MKRASLREKCPYSELFWSLFSRIWTEYGDTLRISPYSVRMRENMDQNNSEYAVLFLITYNIQLGNKKLKTLQEKICRIKLFLDEIHLWKITLKKSISFDFLASISLLWKFELCLNPSYFEFCMHAWFMRVCTYPMKT